MDLENGRAYRERCADAFMEHFNRGTLESHMNPWTVFGGEHPQDPLGFYDDFDSALTAACSTYTSGSFIVRLINEEYREHGKWGRPECMGPNFGKLTSRHN